MNKAGERSKATRTIVIGLLNGITAGFVDPYEGYKQLYSYWCSNNAAVPELRPLFRIPGIDAGGCFEVTNDFKTGVITIAARINETLSTQI